MHDVIIVGAGPTGLTLAAVLARHGVKARLIDARESPPEDRSRAVVLQARTLELFRDLGIDGEVEKLALHVDAVTLVLPGGKRESLRFLPEWVESRFNRITSLPQEETERILASLVEEDGVHIERGVTLISAQEMTTAVECVLEHADGHRESASTRWLVGSDGAHSVVRQAAELSFDGETYNDEAMLGDVDIEWPIAHDAITLCPGASGFLLSFPLPGENRFRIIMIRPASAPVDARGLERDEFLGAMRELLPPGTAVSLRHARWLTRYRLHRRGVPRYRTGRMFVAGDAAHIHSPVGAQGMNTGIQDAYNLGWKLALVARGQAHEAILESYDAERHPVGKKLLEGTDLAFGVLARGGGVARWLRRLMPALGVRLLSAGVVAHRLSRLVSQTGIRYRHSPIVVNAAHASQLPKEAPRAGDRLPEIRLPDGSWLQDVARGSTHVALIIGNVQSTVLEQLAKSLAAYETEVRVVTIAQCERLAGDEGALYVVRPDKHIGFRGIPSDVAALDAWLGRLLVVRREAAM